VSHLLVTNDFPPKVGGIQSYLWELWRRLPAERVTVLTTPYEGAADFDAEQPFAVHRTTAPVLLPQPGLVRLVNRAADEAGAKLVVLDPALPLGMVGPYLDRPYALVLHGAEVTVPSRLPASRQALKRVLAGADLLVAAGGYPAAEAARLLGDRDGDVDGNRNGHGDGDGPMRETGPTTVNVPPGVDTGRFRPLSEAEKATARAKLGLPSQGPLVTSVSRLVPRKGMDVLIKSAADLKRTHPDLTVAIAGTGRDRRRLERLTRHSGAPVRFLGRVAEADLPLVYGCGDVFTMLCRNRWGGLEQEGFGIVFLEAAATGVPQVAGDSGGARDAVQDDVTGLVVPDPRAVGSTVAAIARLLDDAGLRMRLGSNARERAVAEFDYDVLAARLDAALQEHGG
jgi:phosphatidylinositol alpha-1,6-mannosyltransferase